LQFERESAVIAPLGPARTDQNRVLGQHNGARGAVYADSVLLIVGGLLSAVTFMVTGESTLMVSGGSDFICRPVCARTIAESWRMSRE
jgi:hypothetical protein